MAALESSAPTTKRQRTDSMIAGDRARSMDLELADLRREVWGIETDISLLNDHQGDANSKITLLTSIVTKQAQMLANMHNKLVDLQRISMKNNVILHNVPERDDENACDLVRQLLSNKTGIQVDLERAHRMGAPREQGHRPLIARFNRQDQVDAVLLRTKPEKGKPFDKRAIRVTPQIPNDLRHARAKMHFMAEHYRETDSNVKIKVHEDKIIVNGVTKRDQITPPTVGQILEIDQNEMSDLRNYKFIHSDEKVLKGSRFRVYCHPVRTLADVRKAYRAISTIPEVAKCTHLICAYKIDEKAKGYQDDGDFDFGQQIMRTLTDKQQLGFVYFLTRQYGGRHLGRRRFQLVHELIKQTIDRTTTLGAPVVSSPKSKPPILNDDEEELDQDDDMQTEEDWRVQPSEQNSDNGSAHSNNNPWMIQQPLEQRKTKPRARPNSEAAKTPATPNPQGPSPGAAANIVQENGAANLVQNPGVMDVIKYVAANQVVSQATNAASPGKTSIVLSFDGTYD